MEQYISKSALVAEIEKQIELAKLKAQQAQENNDYVSCVGWSEHFATCGDILKIINTFEVREVDLDFQRFAKEMDAIFALPSSETENTEENPLNWEYAIAKHFYELGLSVSNKEQKGE